MQVFFSSRKHRERKGSDGPFKSNILFFQLRPKPQSFHHFPNCCSTLEPVQMFQIQTMSSMFYDCFVIVSYYCSPWQYNIHKQKECMIGMYVYVQRGTKSQGWSYIDAIGADLAMYSRGLWETTISCLLLLNLILLHKYNTYFLNPLYCS